MRHLASDAASVLMRTWSGHSFFPSSWTRPEKLALYLEDPNHVKFAEEVIKPNIAERLALDYEMEPGKKTR